MLTGAVFVLSRSGLLHWRPRVAASPAGEGSRPLTISASGRASYAQVSWWAGKVGTDAASASSGASVPLALTPAGRHACPAAATACVDLKDHLTWLQSGGKVTFGPVRMEPGPPGTSNATPHGTFHVQWKAGPGFVSSEYGDPMPWATFFAPGGVAFHGGSLTKASHGCVHLTGSNAHYFQNHLPIGAEVVVF